MADDDSQRFEIVKQRLLSGTTVVMLTGRAAQKVDQTPLGK